jgi:sensor histidine kinase YesM
MEELEKVIKAAYLELESIEKSPFSDEGFIEFRQKISQYIIQLFDESIRTARKSNIEIVSPTHVENASNYLIKKQHSKKNTILSTIGGLLLGTAFSNILSISIYSIKYSTFNIILTIFFAIIGSFLLGLYLSKE